MLRRPVRSLLATCVLVPALVAAVGGCGDDGGGVALKWWDYYGDLPSTNKALSSLIDQYEKAHPNVSIERTTVGFKELKAKIIQGAATGDLPDIVIVDNPDHQALADQGALADLTSQVSRWSGRDAYLPGPWQSTVYRGRNYGIPFASNATALYYNADDLERAGVSPPADWTELRSAAARLTTSERSGFCFSAAASEEGTFTFLPFLWQAGGDLRPFRNPATVDALSLWDDLVNVDRSAPREVVTWTQDDVYNAFISGRCAMMINGPWQLSRFETDKVEFRWEVAPSPRNVRSASALGGENFAIGKGTHTEAAWDVLTWMAEPGHVREALVASGFLPNRKDMVDDPAFSGRNVNVFVDQVEIARPRAYGPVYPQVSSIVSRTFQQTLTRQKTPQQAVEEAAPEIEQLLDRP